MNKISFKTIPLLGSFAFVLAACGGGSNSSGGAAKLKVWCPTEDRQVMNKITADYTALNPQITFDIKEVAEGSVATEMQKDQDAAADVFALADDNLKKLVKQDMLLNMGKSGSTYYNQIYNDNLTWTAEAATVNGSVYGFPQTSDNGYFLWYNSDYVTEEQAKTLEGLCDAATAARKKLCINIQDSWIFSSFFFANGGTISCDETDRQLCDYANANGQAAATAAASFVQNNKGLILNNLSNSDVSTNMGNKTAIAAFTGTWNYEQLKASLGDKIKTVKMPTMTINGATKQMGSFRSAKIVSIKSNTKYPEQALAFAKYATSEEAQLYRFQQRSVGPSNKVVAESSEVKNHMMQKAVIAQDPYAVPQQKNISGNGKYWDAVKALGQAIWANPANPWESYGNVSKYLTAMVSQMN